MGSLNAIPSGGKNGVTGGVPVAPFFLVQPFEGLRLGTVAVVIDVACALCAFQCDRVRRLRTIFLLCWLRFGSGRASGFAGVADVGADWVDHMKKDR